MQSDQEYTTSASENELDARGEATESMDELQETAVPISIQHDESMVAGLTNKVVRLQADFDNYRKRNALARTESRDETRREVLTALLPIYDNFLRALQHASDQEDYSGLRQGIDGIRLQLEEFFKAQGLQAIAAEPGTAFDPHLHDAAGTMAGNDENENSVAQELVKGFSHKGQVIRPAQVLVFAAYGVS